MNSIDQLINWLNGLYHIPPVLFVVMACIAVGYALKLIPQFPNGGIPLAVILLGGVLMPLLADTKEPGASLRVWLVRNACIGLFFGLISWLFHNQILRRFEEKIPFLGALIASAPKGDDSKK